MFSISCNMVQFIAIAHVNLIIVHTNGTSAVQPVQFISIQKRNKNETYVFIKSVLNILERFYKEVLHHYFAITCNRR
jgi:hypothetical protein